MPQRSNSQSRANLEAALARNVFGDSTGAPGAGALADYVVSVDAALAGAPLEDFATGRFRFPEGKTAPGG